VEGDLLDRDSLLAAMEGVDTAYYLVHSLSAGSEFEEADRRAAKNFAWAAKAAGVGRIIYLGALANEVRLSPHLKSRLEVGRILRDSGVPTIEFRASIIIGSGSLSFEVVRALVDRLPVLTPPRWVRTPAQPIAIEDAIAYLMAALTVDLEESAVFEIGGADRVSYQQIMVEYAHLRGLKRLIIPLPVLMPGLSSLWLGLVTPVYARTGRNLIDSTPHETLVNDDRALRVFPIRPRGIREAVERALTNEDREMAETHWSDALSSRGPTRTWGGVKFGSRLVDSRVARVVHPVAQAFRPIRRIGGQTGWYYANWMWRLRGFIDRLVGGPGLRRGRRDPEWALAGDHLDFWRVEAFEPNHLLRLFAEMKLPGRAWLQFEVDEDDIGTIIRQTAIFDPIGLFGLLYWYALFPVHSLIFRGMLRRIVKALDKQDESSG
jgi:uncharacterized protein YbjT (DUF2867 family)